MTPAVSGDDSTRAGAALERLAALHPKLIDLGLDRTRDLLARLGNPHQRLPPVIHVAGTNGKGSVIATMRAMAEALGTEPLLVVARRVTPGDPAIEPMPVDTSGIPNDHLQYAITWFSLAVVWLIMTAYYIVRQRKTGET